MKITFVLPGFSARPIGGFAVVYRYANELFVAVTQLRSCIQEPWTSDYVASGGQSPGSGGQKLW